MLKNIVGYLEDSASKYSHKEAYSDGTRTITFGRLRTNALKVASALINDVPAKTPVIVFMEKTVDCIEAFLGIAYTGAFYVPIDIHMPLNRVKLIMDTLSSDIIITRRADNIPDEISEGNRIFFIEDILNNQSIDEEAIAQRQKRAIDTDPMYAIFTSGSTGVPKGVLVSHRSVINFTEWWSETFEFDDKEVFANQTPFYFDASVKDIYATLRCGSTMHIVPRKLFSLPKQLVQFLNENRVTCIDWVPSALCMIVNFRTFEKEIPHYLKKVMFLGEVMPTKQYNMWKKALPDVKFANLYGPTEATGDCTYYKLERDFADDEPIPIGYECNNTDVLLLDEEDRLITDPDITGEICVRGCSLALGYFNNPEKTASSFVQNPLQKNYPEKIYRTGDLAKYNSYGELVFLSRKDSQIKHMGHRIELGEIETAFGAVPGINSVCCLYDNKSQKIIAVYEGEPEKSEVQALLRDHLPQYMLPNVYHKIDSMPINLNGKTDRVLLKETYIK